MPPGLNLKKKLNWLNCTFRNCSHKDTQEIRLSRGFGGLCGSPVKASQDHGNCEWQPHLCSDPEDDLLATVWPFRMLFSHLSYCETALKINAISNVQGQTDITCSRPNEKQTEGPKEVTSFLFVLCISVLQDEWGRGGERHCWFLWLLHVSSKAYLIFIFAELGHALNWSRDFILFPSLCLIDGTWSRYFASLIISLSKSKWKIWIG